MNPVLQFLPITTEEIGETYSWYENRRPGLGEEFLAELHQSLIEVQNRPRSFPLVTGSIRRAILKRFPYCVYFVMRQDDLVVLAVLHGGRRSGLWKQRKPQ